MCRTYGFLIELLIVQHAAFDAGNLGADEGSAVFEGLRVDLRPHVQLSVVIQHRFKCLGLSSGVA